MHRILLMTAVLAAVAATAGCASTYKTDIPSPQEIVVLDAVTQAPVVGAEIEYRITCIGPPATIHWNKKGQMEVIPDVYMDPAEKPMSPPLGGDDPDKSWRDFNQPAGHGPIFNPDGTWNTASFRERTLERMVRTDSAGRALLPVLHAPIEFRSCEVRVSRTGFKPLVRLIRPADLATLPKDGRLVHVALTPGP